MNTIIMIHLDISLYYIGPPTGPVVPAPNMTAAVAESVS